MKDTLAYILSTFVEKPEEVKVEESEQNGVTTFTIHVASEDIGKVIGKEGKVIRALKNIMKISAMKSNQRIYLTIADKEQ